MDDLVGAERDIFCYNNRYGVEGDDLVELVSDTIRVYCTLMSSMSVTESRSPTIPQALRDIRRGDVGDILS